jgi:hypothetical protein
MPSLQTLLWQSDGIEQAAVGAQAGQLSPPQSTSVSPPFITPSVQLGVAHVVPRQTPLAQSVFTRQASPDGHGAHEPPQSVAVSRPFLMPSAQLPDVHCPVTQKFEAQSPFCEQAFPLSHGEQSPPPQSRSVSLPFWTKSLHVGIAHVSLGPQTRLPQSPAQPHF